ncbi:hypothetical protein FSARC_14836, partial [Fusarium sarcochroum]
CPGPLSAKEGQVKDHPKGDIPTSAEQPRAAPGRRPFSSDIGLASGQRAGWGGTGVSCDLLQQLQASAADELFCALCLALCGPAQA